MALSAQHLPTMQCRLLLLAISSVVTSVSSQEVATVASEDKLANLGLNETMAADAECAMEAGEAVDHLVHSILYVWAASERCGSEGAPVTCEIDVMSTIHSVSSLADAVLKVLEGCGKLPLRAELVGYECGKGVNALTSGSTGLAAAISGIAHRCPKMKPGTAWQAKPPAVTKIEPNKCIVDVGKIVSSSFKATKTLMAIKQVCTSSADPSECPLKSISIVSLIADVAAFIASSVRDCGGLHGMGVKGVGWAVSDDAAGCGEAILEMISSLNEIAAIGMKIPNMCHFDTSLPTLSAYDASDSDSLASRLSSGSVTLALAAVLPISMVFSFFGGSRFAQSRMKPKDLNRAAQDAYQGISGDVTVAVPEESLGLSFSGGTNLSPSMARTPRFTPRPDMSGTD